MTDSERIPGQQMLTEDHRCGWCGEPVKNTVSEPYGEYADSRGFMTFLGTNITLLPCGHTWMEVNLSP
jgi:hypothetical protein